MNLNQNKLGLDRRLCQGIYRQVKINGTLSDRKRTGCPPLFDLQEKERLLQFITQNRVTRRLSWDQIRDYMGYSCSGDLIRSTLSSMGYHKRIPRQKFGIRPYNAIRRVEWCQQHLDWTYDDWVRVLWCDESWFSTVGFHQRSLVIRNSKEVGHPDCLDTREKSGRKGIIVWGAFCGLTRSELVFVPSNVSLDSTRYINYVLEPHLIPFWHQCCETYGWVRVVEDNAPGHKGFSNSYRERNEVDKIDWPPQSPDLNLIEMVWSIMECELGETWGRIEDLELMRNALKVVWDSITGDTLDRLVKSMPERLQAVIDAKGGPTMY